VEIVVGQERSREASLPSPSNIKLALKEEPSSLLLKIPTAKIKRKLSVQFPVYLIAVLLTLDLLMKFIKHEKASLHHYLNDATFVSFYNT